MRVALIRTGVVLGREGGALAKMLPPFKAFVGGPIGGGRQWMSWIHLDDLVGSPSSSPSRIPRLGPAQRHRAESGHDEGVRRRPSGTRSTGRASCPCPRPPSALLLGEMATVVLDGQRVVPKKAEALGFPFRFPEIDAALRDVAGD